MALLSPTGISLPSAAGGGLLSPTKSRLQNTEAGGDASGSGGARSRLHSTPTSDADIWTALQVGPLLHLFMGARLWHLLRKHSLPVPPPYQHCSPSNDA